MGTVTTKTQRRVASSAAPDVQSVEPVDPITLQVIGGSLDSIAGEMARVLYRMSFSSIIRESQDLGAGLFDLKYQTMCESESTPMHIGSIPAYLRGIESAMAKNGERWEEGDVVVHNHPYLGASHTPDLAIVSPIFVRGELVGYSANTAHHLDIGAATPGLIIDVGDVYAEGMLFAGVKLYSHGIRNDGVFEMIRANSRMGTQVVHDVEAQVSSVRLGIKRFKELMERFGRDTVFAASAELMNYAERRMRERIAEIPDGTYRARGLLDDDGKRRDVHLAVCVAVIVEGDSITVDLTGSAAQTPTAYNVPFEGSCKVAAFAAFRKLLLDAYTAESRVPSNEGSFRPITVKAPLGTIFNPRYPAACEARFTQCNRMIDLILEALAPVLPNDVIAGSSASISFASYSGVRDDGEYWVFLEVNEGAYGGRPRSDGPDCIDNLMANTRNNPIEDLALHLPLVCDRYELRDDLPDGTGSGKFRGGIGVVKAQRFLGPGVVTMESERHLEAPLGAFGGRDGLVGRNYTYNTKVGAPDKVRELPSKFSGFSVEAGDVVVYCSPCGGGFGDPLERDPRRVKDDVLDGVCSAEAADSVYGVVLDREGNVDDAATSARRSAMRIAATA